MGPGGRLMSDVASIGRHLVAIGVVRGSCTEEVCVRIYRCSGDSACRNAFRRVFRILPSSWGCAQMGFSSERK